MADRPSTRLVRILAVALLLAASGGANARPAAQGTKGSIAYRPVLVLQLGVSNLEKAIAFYRDVMEFQVKELREDLKFAHIVTNVPGLEIGLSDGSTRSGTGAAVVNIGVADVAAARAAREPRRQVHWTDAGDSRQGRARRLHRSRRQPAAARGASAEAVNTHDPGA